MHLSERLEGRDLDDGWRVINKPPSEQGMTGGHFSIGYKAERADGRQGFMKVLNFSKALEADDPAEILENLTTAFNFERRLLERCRRLSRVVSALAGGTVTERLGGHTEVAQYIIFELAESDLRKHTLLKAFDLALNLRTLHHVATGLSQLHASEIAHQDIKPSNILLFGLEESKIGDLGRSSVRGNAGPHDDLQVPGDRIYAPPELIYGNISRDWNIRRKASDLYQLGSLIAFMFTGVGLTQRLINHMPDEHRPRNCVLGYSDILPYMSEYFRLTVEELESRFPTDMRD